jgi:hypothetical protein
MKPAPPMKSAAPPAAIPAARALRKDQDEELSDKISTRKKKALEIKKVQKGVKEFGASDPATLPQSGTTSTGVTKTTKT